MQITQVPKSPTHIGVVRGVHGRPHLTKAEDNDRPGADYFGLGLEKAAFDVWPGGWRKGGGQSERWRQSPPVSGVKQHHGNGPARPEQMNDSQREGRGGGGGEPLQRPA